MRAGRGRRAAARTGAMCARPRARPAGGGHPSRPAAPRRARRAAAWPRPTPAGARASCAGRPPGSRTCGRSSPPTRARTCAVPAVVAQAAQAQRELRIGRRDGAGVAVGAQRLPRIEAEGGGGGVAADGPAVVARTVRLSGVLDDRDARSGGRDRGHVGGIAVEVHRRIALVFGVTARATCSGDIVHVASSTSTSTGVAPVRRIAPTVAMNVCETVMTSSPDPTPSAFRMSSMAVVPFETPIASGASQNAANSSSKALVSAALMNDWRSSTRPIAASISGPIARYCAFRSTSGMVSIAALMVGRLSGPVRHRSRATRWPPRAPRPPSRRPRSR